MVTVLVNPVSGGGAAVRALPGIEAVLSEHKIEYTVKKTIKQGDSGKIARAAVAAGHDAIIVAGGDGTIGEVLDGIVGSSLAIIYAPCGTGNDFVKSMHIPVDPIQAVKKQIASPLRRLDYATVNGKAFMNVCGTGFDVDVLKHLNAHRSKRKGMKAYLFALKDALKYYKGREFEISVDGGPFEKRSLCILSVGNGKYIGGGMKAVPDAVPYDGILNLVMVRTIKKILIPFLLPFFIFGKHYSLSITEAMPCKRVIIRSKGMTMQLDGELYDMDEADIAIVTGGVSVRY